MEQIQPEIFSVTALTQSIKRDLEGEFANVWVEGEISNLALPRSGHTYFTLKDAGAQLKAVIFKYMARSVKFELENGMQVLLRGSLSVYEPRGEYQLIVSAAEPRGAGALQAAFEQLKQRLNAEGLFDPAHKKPIPILPKKIGVVTSATGAAIRDILNVVNRRFANVQILIAPVRVQGAEAPGEIANAIAMLNRLPDVDVLIVGRGGGSMEDLWAFNEEVVARAIFASRIPIISAVGHEIDFTIADFVADLRAPTPSAAAELVVQNKANLIHTVNVLTTRLRQNFFHELQRRKERAAQLRRRLPDPKRRVNELQQRIDDLFQRLGRAWQFVFEQKSAQRNTLLAKLDTLSPLGLFAKGYAICRNMETQQPIKSIHDARVGDHLLVRVSDGELCCEVHERLGAQTEYSPL
ncbi:exodeoxyribonuclease 7 large subunit [Candidatus Moduliflexus flocculans]|uniref:Exodeoxyribonuclease 7 large subunit n=1 Tax=Candidatus Moduliflexus flocculans TaxID=1499966 RepID=A0A081BSL9_9BACT|nr:exodeoxyribonuclease 7 large subunit [Candidatus Moduliflexus flocculans]